MDRKKRKGGADRERDKKKRAIEEEAAKCHKLTDMFRSPTPHQQRDDAATSKLT
ncbi:hypothetical protein ABVT39_003398 [Epinephelus coioides]